MRSYYVQVTFPSTLSLKCNQSILHVISNFLCAFKNSARSSSDYNHHIGCGPVKISFGCDCNFLPLLPPKCQCSAFCVLYPGCTMWHPVGMDQLISGCGDCCPVCPRFWATWSTYTCVTFIFSRPVHTKGMHKQNTRLCTALGCRVHHLSCTVQPRGSVQEWGLQVLTFAHVG